MNRCASIRRLVSRLYTVVTTILLAVGAQALSANAAPETELALGGAQFDLFVFEAGPASAEQVFFVDDSASEVHVRFVHIGELIATRILAPGGAIIDEGTIEQLGGTCFTFDMPDGESSVMPSINHLTGRHVMYDFPSLGAGEYVIEYGPAQLADYGMVDTVILTDGEVRATVFPTLGVHAVGRDTGLFAIVFDGENALTGATVEAAVMAPDDTITDVPLLDNGLDHDALAGDGIYSGAFTPDQPGEHGLVADISGQRGSGASFALQAATAFEVIQSCAALSGTITTELKDSDNDGVKDQLHLKVGIIAEGYHEVSVVVILESSTGHGALARGQKIVAPGNRTVTAIVGTDQLDVDGPYTIRQVQLNCHHPTTGMVLADWVPAGEEQTPAISLAGTLRPALELSGNYSETVYDEDPDGPGPLVGDGDYDSLVVAAGIYANTANTYHYRAELVDSCGRSLAVARGSQSLNKRPVENSLLLSFSGSDIGSTGVSGPYRVASLSVRHAPVEAYWYNVLETTGAYAATQFDSYAPFTDCNNNGQPDHCDMPDGTNDLNYNQIPDDCEPDCNASDTPDDWELSNGLVPDCNANSIPDSCDIASAVSVDTDANGVPDECETGACCVGEDCSDGVASTCATFVCDVAGHLPGSFTGCHGDADGNGFVQVADRGFISAAFGLTDDVSMCLYDMDGNGTINAADRGVVSANTGQCPALPDYQNGSGLNGGNPDTRFTPAIYAGHGTTCAVEGCGQQMLAGGGESQSQSAAAPMAGESGSAAVALDESSGESAVGADAWLEFTPAATAGTYDVIWHSSLPKVHGFVAFVVGDAASTVDCAAGSAPGGDWAGSFAFVALGQSAMGTVAAPGYPDGFLRQVMLMADGATASTQVSGVPLFSVTPTACETLRIQAYAWFVDDAGEMAQAEATGEFAIGQD